MGTCLRVNRKPHNPVRMAILPPGGVRGGLSSIP